MSRMVERAPLIRGERFGRLTVVERVEDTIVSGKWSLATYKLSCDCGGEIITRKDSLRNGRTNSCGCIHNEQLVERNTTHGNRHAENFNLYFSMIQRCHNSDSDSYKYYGARGILVCERWLNSYESFAEDMGERPEGTSLDRIDNNAGYCKENCRWATRHEQAINKNMMSTNKSGRTGVEKHKYGWYARITANGVSYCSEILKTFEDAVKRREEYELKYHGRVRPVEYEKSNKEGELP